MKRLFFLIVLFVSAFSLQAQQKSTSKLVSKKVIKKDSVKLFYGLTAQKFLSLTVPEGKNLMKKEKITLSQFLSTNLEAKNYLLELQIKKDSIETMRIYDRIEKKLSMKKKNE